MIFFTNFSSSLPTPLTPPKKPVAPTYGPVFRLLYALSDSLVALVMKVKSAISTFFDLMAECFRTFDLGESLEKKMITAKPVPTAINPANPRPTTLQIAFSTQSILITKGPTEPLSSPPTSPILTSRTPGAIIILPQAIDVLDDGNCLFYSLALAFLHRYQNCPEIREKLATPIDSIQSLGNLLDRHAVAQQLSAIATTLRHQAADYLTQHKDDDDDQIFLALMEGLNSHREEASRQMEETRGVATVVLTDIRELLESAGFSNLCEKIDAVTGFGILPPEMLTRLQTQIQKELPNSSYKTQLMQKCAQLDAIRVQLREQQQRLPDNFKDYIAQTRESGVFCGVAQIVALSQYYQIPIEILYGYHPDTRSWSHRQRFSARASQRSPSRPIATLAHVNGNHFQYIVAGAPAEPSEPSEDQQSLPLHNGNRGEIQAQESHSAAKDHRESMWELHDDHT